MIKLFNKRFKELADQLDAIEKTKQIKHSELRGQYDHIDGELLLNWCVKAQNLISRACGDKSQHFISFEESEKPRPYSDNFDKLKRMKAVFLAAKEDYEGGYIASAKNLVQAEVFDSELEQASELLASGYASAAAVIAGTVLETTLRNICDKHGLSHGKLDKMNADLAKLGEYSIIVQKRITTLAGIRNSAAHGKTNEFTKDDVASMITEIERFIANALA